MNPIRYLDPRRYLAAAIGWAMVSVVLAAAVVGANQAANEAEERARADTERLLSQFATQIHHIIDIRLLGRQRLLQTTAALIAANHRDGAGAADHGRSLEALRAQFPEFVWLGLADERGRILATAGKIMRESDVAERAWFQRGREGHFLGDAREMPLSDENPAVSTLKSPGPDPVVAVPMVSLSGQRIGVLGGRLSLAWIESQETEFVSRLETRRSLSIVLATADGVVALGPPEWRGRTLDAKADLSEAGRYVVSHHLSPKQPKGYSLTVYVREEADTALARAKLAYHTVFRVVLSAGLVSALIAVWVTISLTLRLRTLDEQSQAVRQRVRASVPIPGGNDEIHRVGATLSDLVNHLQQEKQALAALNAQLDARVAERTARIEWLAQEARHAAVTRERLRLARELHDTLAHSLMALLTQIRLIRKLRDRLDPAELDGELERAEEVAATGLAEARAAITQMRHNRVRDEGLGSALRQLLRRFEQRCGVSAALEADARAASLADGRAETVFRIVEEALNNVERHAEAQTVTVRLQWLESVPREPLEWNADDPVRVRIEVIDNGVGFDPSVPCPGHYGLHGIREQAALIQARFELHSHPGAGARLALEYDA